MPTQEWSMTGAGLLFLCSWFYSSDSRVEVSLTDINIWYEDLCTLGSLPFVHLHASNSYLLVPSLLIFLYPGSSLASKPISHSPWVCNYSNLGPLAFHTEWMSSGFSSSHQKDLPSSLSFKSTPEQNCSSTIKHTHIPSQCSPEPKSGLLFSFTSRSYGIPCVAIVVSWGEGLWCSGSRDHRVLLHTILALPPPPFKNVDSGNHGVEPQHLYFLVLQVNLRGHYFWMTGQGNHSVSYLPLTKLLFLTENKQTKTHGTTIWK